MLPVLQPPIRLSLLLPWLLLPLSLPSPQAYRPHGAVLPRRARLDATLVEIKHSQFLGHPMHTCRHNSGALTFASVADVCLLPSPPLVLLLPLSKAFGPHGAVLPRRARLDATL